MVNISWCYEFRMMCVCMCEQTGGLATQYGLLYFSDMRRGFGAAGHV